MASARAPRRCPPCHQARPREACWPGATPSTSRRWRRRSPPSRAVPSAESSSGSEEEEVHDGHTRVRCRARRRPHLSTAGWPVAGPGHASSSASPTTTAPGPRTRSALVARLSELAGVGRRIVDLGAGTGLLAAPLARRGTRSSPSSPRARCSPSAPRRVPASRSRRCSRPPSRPASATFMPGWSSSQMPSTGSVPMPRGPRRAGSSRRTAWRRSSAPNRWNALHAGAPRAAHRMPIRRPGACPAAAGPGSSWRSPRGRVVPDEEHCEQRASSLAPRRSGGWSARSPTAGPALGPARLERLLERGGRARRARGPRVGPGAAAVLAQARAAFTPDSNASTSAVTGAVTMLAAGSSNGARPIWCVPSDGNTGASR